MMEPIRSCHRGEVIYNGQVRLNWNFLQLALLAAALLAGAGCSGINASQSVSPATFFLPGLMKNEAPAHPQDLTPAIPCEIASAN
jgi:hypothetical protein